MKKLLFTIAGLLQVVLVMAQEPRIRGAVSHNLRDQAAQKAAGIFEMQKQATAQNTTKAWLIVDVEGSMPNGRIPGPKGLYESMPYRAIKHH